MHTSYVLVVGPTRPENVLPYVIWSNLIHRVKLTHRMLKMEKVKRSKRWIQNGFSCHISTLTLLSFFFKISFHWLSEAF